MPVFVLLFSACRTGARGAEEGRLDGGGGRGERGGVLPALTLITKALRIMPGGEISKRLAANAAAKRQKKGRTVYSGDATQGEAAPLMQLQCENVTIES